MRGKALALIESFPVSDANFNNVYPLLKTKFFDENILVVTILDKMLNWPAITNNSIEQVQELLTFLKFKLAELAELKVSYRTEEKSVIILLSLVVRKKIPRSFLMELTRKTGSSYPLLDEILQHSSDIIKLLQIRNPASVNALDSGTKHNGTCSRPSKPGLPDEQSHSRVKSKGNNVAVIGVDDRILKSTEKSGCKFCF